MQTLPSPIAISNDAPPRAALDAVRIVNLPRNWLEDWQALEDRLQSDHLTCSATWTRIWLKHYGGLVPHRLAIASQQGQTVGMSLITNGVGQRDGPYSVKTLHVGTAGEPDQESVCVEYNRLLVAPEHRAEYTRLLLSRILKHESWEVFQLDGLAADDAREFLDGSPTSIREIPSHYCDLNLFRTAQAEPWRMFGESTRTNLRRSLRDLGDVQLDWADTPDQALEFYEEMIIHHQARWKAVGKDGVFSSPRFKNFHHDLIEALISQGRATLVRARQGDRVLGILYLLIEDNRLLYYQSGLPEHGSKLSLGNVTLYLTMLEGSRRGYDAFDFMAGDAQYKRVLSTNHNTLTWLKWRRPSMKFLLLDGLRALKGTKQ